MKPINYLFLACILLLTACAAPKNLEFKGIESLKIEKASFGKNIFIASFAYHNPNNFNLVINKLDCAVYINNEFFTKYKIDSNYAIAANANFATTSSHVCGVGCAAACSFS